MDLPFQGGGSAKGGGILDSIRKAEALMLDEVKNSGRGVANSRLEDNPDLGTQGSRHTDRNGGRTLATADLEESGKIMRKRPLW